MTVPLATQEFAAGGLDGAIDFLKRTRWELRSLRMVRVWKDKLRVFDVNGDFFELNGIGYENTDIIPLLKLINTAYNPQTVHQPIDQEYKEFKTGRRHPWAEDRVM